MPRSEAVAAMIAAIASTLAAVTAMPLLVFSMECLAGLKRGGLMADASPAPPFAVLIPAHDEAAGIERTLAAVIAQLRPCDSLLVIADNCSDATADVAARAGAWVVSRRDPARTGKGFALGFGRSILQRAPPSVVIVLDADCTPQPGALMRLAATAGARNGAVQARNLLTCDADAPPLVRISTFAFLVKNLIRQRGLQRLGGGALLQGTGMAMPWHLFVTAPLATQSLVEDMQLGLDLRLAGHLIWFDEAARVTSPAAGERATHGQRTRWEQGMLTTAAAYLPRLLLAGLMGRPRLLLVAADMAVPPLALLASIVGLAAIVLALAAIAFGTVLPLLVLTAAAALFAGSLVLAWHSCGQGLLAPRDLIALARYVAWKQPIYRRIMFDRERRWVRTSRLP